MPATIESLSLPPVLYRYRSLGDASDRRGKALVRELDALETGTLWCGSYQNMNDAMEGLFQAGDEVRGNPDWRDARDIIRHDKSHLGVACFSEAADHPLMWAHYGNAFKGICVEYDFERLRQVLPSSSSFAKVSYVDRIPDIGTELRDPRTMAKWILSTKNQHWSYEREWRLFSSDQGAIPGARAAINKVIVGPKMPEPMVSLVEQALRGTVPVLRARVSGYNISVDDGLARI